MTEAKVKLSKPVYMYDSLRQFLVGIGLPHQGAGEGVGGILTNLATFNSKYQVLTQFTYPGCWY